MKIPLWIFSAKTDSECYPWIYDSPKDELFSEDIAFFRRWSLPIQRMGCFEALEAGSFTKVCCGEGGVICGAAGETWE
ncbi:hypothetical protein AVEN_186935-1 [Araneus ventricosus]|uniref:Uncharacterized protein n=1 Tax=Araneus ventricosus TaxID=182803 RepID=A0A4Y2MVM4_ARAVE|nr:hypothetical protein AVEN_186935-1 [Araneus ventricosus]